MDALNLGFENAQGKIIAFLDDDVIPLLDWVQKHLETYVASSVGGVAGNVIPATLIEENLIPTNDKASEIIPNCKPFLDSIGRKIWNRPLEGLEDYLVYVSIEGRSGGIQFSYITVCMAPNYKITSWHGRQHVCFIRCC